MDGNGHGVVGVGIIITGGSSINETLIPANEFAPKKPNIEISTVNFKKDKRFFITLFFNLFILQINTKKIRYLLKMPDLFYGQGLNYKT